MRILDAANTEVRLALAAASTWASGCGSRCLWKSRVWLVYKFHRLLTHTAAPPPNRRMTGLSIMADLAEDANSKVVTRLSICRAPADPGRHPPRWGAYLQLWVGGCQAACVRSPTVLWSGACGDRGMPAGRRWAKGANSALQLGSITPAASSVLPFSPPTAMGVPAGAPQPHRHASRCCFAVWWAHVQAARVYSLLAH